MLPRPRPSSPTDLDPGATITGRRSIASVTRAKKFRRPCLGPIALYFKLRDDSNDSFKQEIIAGITQYLVCLYSLSLSRTLQAGPCPDCTSDGVGNATSEAGFSNEQYRALPTAAALTAGVACVLIGVIAGVPFVLAPGITTAIPFNRLAVATNTATASTATFIVGLMIAVFALTSKRIRAIMSLPEDFRLGVAAGIGALLALVGLRDMGWIQPTAATFVTTYHYSSILGIVGIVAIAVVQSLAPKYRRWSYIFSAVLVAVISLIIRAAQGVQIVEPNSAGAIPLAPLQRGLDFSMFDSASFQVGRYIVVLFCNHVIDLTATTTALILCAVMTKLGYSKETFVSVLSESDKVVRIYAVDALINIVMVPFLGVQLVTPFIESAAGIAIGGRTGLTAVVAGVLFLLSSLFAIPITSIIPPYASGSSVVMGCFCVVEAIKYVDFDRPSKSVPSLLAFFMIPFSGSIGVGVSFAYMTLLPIWVLTPNIVHITPQIIGAFSLCVILLTLETGLITSVDVMGWLILALGVFTILTTIAYHTEYGKDWRAENMPLSMDGMRAPQTTTRSDELHRMAIDHNKRSRRQVLRTDSGFPQQHTHGTGGTGAGTNNTGNTGPPGPSVPVSALNLS